MMATVFWDHKGHVNCLNLGDTVAAQ